jgi:uncharacterized lipoprotein YmbA
MTVAMKPCMALVALIGLAGCSSSPQPSTYVLSAPVDPVAGVRDEAGRPVVELPTVSLPDYLDSMDILLRDGRNELKPSATGRWGERMSVGITHALEGSLARHLPGVLVVHSALSGQPAQRLLIDVDAFDVQPDGRCVLAARWTIPGQNPGTVALAERGTFVTMAASPAATGSKELLSDAAIVSAMTAAVDQLADRIAISLRRGSTRPR